MLDLGAQASRVPHRLRLLTPTAGQPRLDGSIKEGVFMDTGAGNPTSGMFGNTRKYADGSPRFHEGIDIAPAHPWKRNTLPNDVVRAVAEGLVVYVNTYTKNESLYGNYVVMTHTVPGFGEIYTLYGHLRAFASGLRAGIRLKAGSPLGIMGNIPDIPVGRSHLHFEIGVMMNRHYPWIDEQHGVWNGANLYGIDPCRVYKMQQTHGAIDFAELIHTLPIAFKIAFTMEDYGRMDYFKRYQYAMPYANTSHIVISFSSEGIPIALEPRDYRDTPSGTVIDWNPQVVRQGRPYVTKQKSSTRGRLTKRGETLLQNLLTTPSTAPKQPSASGEIG